MNNRFRSCCLLLAIAFAGSSAEPPSLTSDLDERIPATLQAFEVPSVSVAVVQQGQITYTKAFGKADIAADRAAQPSTRYAVGSISKQFTAAAILLEQEQGKLSLDDKVAKYFPELTRAGEITIRELLSHTSGYEDYAPQDYLIPEWTKNTTADEILNRWAKKPLNFDPGTRWQYSNTNYVLAGKILEKVARESLLDFLRQHFFKPLAMSSASDCEARNPEDASSYTRYALGPPRPVGREGAGWYFAAGELCMTATDLARWDSAFLRKQFLSAASYEEFSREVKLKDGSATHYALGLHLGQIESTPIISHGGEVSGFLAENTVIPSKDSAVVVLTNEDGVNLIGPMSDLLGSLLIHPPGSASRDQDDSVRAILIGLQSGKIDRSRFTDDANSYFTPLALDDYRNSLAGLGKLNLLTRQGEQLRGGMNHLSYRALYDKSAVLLNIYITADGKYEQFLVEQI